MNDRRPSKRAWPESPSIADRWSSGKGLALSRRGRPRSGFFALPLRLAPDRRSLRQPDFAWSRAHGETPAPSSDCTPAFWVTWSTSLTATGALSPPMTTPEFRGNSTLIFVFRRPLGGRFGAREVGQTLRLLVRRLGACAVITRRGRGWEEFGPLDRMRLQQGRIHLLRLERLSRGTMRRSIKSCSRGSGLGR